MAFSKEARRAKIRKRIRASVKGTASRPRLSVFRSNSQIYAQIIDDLKGVTIASASSLVMKDAQKIAKVDQAKLVGKRRKSNCSRYRRGNLRPRWIPLSWTC
jgi:large subunit ribosomal protein L18